MADLKSLLVKNGLKDVVTYIQSGNLIFSSDKSSDDLEKLISGLIMDKYAFEVPVMVRSVEDWKLVFEENPFLLNDPNIEIDRLYVTFLGDEPTATNLSVVNGMSFPNDDFQIIGRSVYILLHKKYSETKLTNSFFESKLKVTATSRNWKTVTKLVEMSL